MALILCLETSYSICSVAILKQDKIISKSGNALFKHAEVLLSLISSCLKESEIEMGAIDAIALSDGPGSYTGLRIGASTAKGLCFGLDIPLLPIGTLKSLANAVYQENLDYDGLVWPMIDARRMEVYHGLFNRNLDSITDISNGVITDHGFRPVQATSNTILCGDGSDKAESILGLRRISIQQEARHLCLLAVKEFEERRFADLTSYQPSYLKSANITTASVNK